MTQNRFYLSLVTLLLLGGFTSPVLATSEDCHQDKQTARLEKQLQKPQQQALARLRVLLREAAVEPCVLREVVRRTVAASLAGAHESYAAQLTELAATGAANILLPQQREAIRTEIARVIVQPGAEEGAAQ